MELVARARGGSRTLYLVQDPPAADNVSVRGWNFIVEDELPDGDVKPVWDTWEERFEEIVAYPELYADEDLHWSNADTGQKVDLAELAKRCL